MLKWILLGGCIAVMAAFYGLLHFMVYGIDPKFGGGFIVGFILAGIIFASAFHLEMKSEVQKAREETAAELAAIFEERGRS